MSSVLTNKLVGVAVAAASIGGAYIFFRNRNTNRNGAEAPPSKPDKLFPHNKKDDEEKSGAEESNIKKDAKTAISKVKDRLNEATTLDKNSKNEQKEQPKEKTASWFGRRTNTTPSSKPASESSDEN